MDKAELHIVRQLLERFNEEVLYCHWKSNQHFEDALKGIDDLDILIDRKQYGKVVSILSELAFKRFYVPAARTYVGIEDFLGFDRETGKLIHLHLHCRLVVGEKHLKGFMLPYENDMLKNRRYDEATNTYMSSYFDELLLLILRIGMKVRKRDMLKGKIIAGSTKAEFDWLKEKCPEFCDCLAQVDWLSPRLKKSIAVIYEGKAGWGKINSFKHAVYKDLAAYSQGCAMVNTFERQRRELARVGLEVKKRIIKSKYTFTRRRNASGGITVAFLGSDGAGKSSAIAAIHKWLFRFMDVRLFYLGSGDGNSSILRLPLKAALKVAQKTGLIKRSRNVGGSDLKEERTDKKPMGMMRRIWVYTLSKERIRKLKQANRCKLAGYVVLTDRYPQNEYDGLCDGRRLRNRKGLAAKTEEKAYRIAKMCPPDLVIKLIVPPDVAAARKPGEIEEETSAKLTERVKNIRFSEFTSCVEIDAAQPQEKVWLDIQCAIWDAL